MYKRQHIAFNKNYNLKNSLELVELTKTITIEPRHTLASFDIVNLYTNVPISETLEIAKNLLLSKSTLNHETVDELINLTKVILEQNYFTFDNKYYLQRDGLAMGSPLSGILVEIYLNHIETNERCV